MNYFVLVYAMSTIITCTYNILKRRLDYLENKRICTYCGWRLDEPDPEILYFLNSGCWKEYRENGLLDPIPNNYW
jgi:hypothetical protein